CTSSPSDPVPSPDTWHARDFLHWKKSGLFLKQLLAKAKAAGDGRFLAYAYGFLVSYAANVCGSPFLNSAVGGPTRTQWWGQRFVKNYVDAWVYGYYQSSATMTDDNPTPPYKDWPNLCDANLQKKIAAGGPDALGLAFAKDLLSRIQGFRNFPEHELPDAFADFWMGAFAAAYGPPPPGSPFTPGALNNAYLMTWLVLWFQTSGEVLGWRGEDPSK